MLIFFRKKKIFFYNFDILNNDHINDSQYYLFDYFYVRLKMLVLKSIIRISISKPLMNMLNVKLDAIISFIVFKNLFLLNALKC